MSLLGFSKVQRKYGTACALVKAPPVGALRLAQVCGSRDPNRLPTPDWAVGPDWQGLDDKRWIVKAPQHFEQLRPIMNVFPDALVIFTHRDPVASMQSILQSYAYAARWRDHVLDLQGYLEYWSDRYAKLRPNSIEVDAPFYAISMPYSPMHLAYGPACRR